MVKHIVAWRLKEHAHGNSKAENAELIKQKLEALPGRIDGLLKIEVGIDFSETDNSSDVVLYSEFASLQDLDAYQVHPLHEAVKPFVVQACVERRLIDYLA